MMKKILTTAIVIAACAALCAAVLPQNDVGGKVPADAESGDLGVYTEELPQPTQREVYAFSDDTPVMPVAEHYTPETAGKTAVKEEIMSVPVTADEPGTAMQETPTAPPAVKSAPQNSAPASADIYHTDVYPNNVYSEELLNDSGGNLVGKTITYPTAFGSDTIWIDGDAYYEVPGFGLVKWSGPSQRTENYIMYESGVKVGIMGGEDEAPSHNASAPSQELPEPNGEVIDQTINTRPEKISTPPDCKPQTTPPMK